MRKIDMRIKAKAIIENVTCMGAEIYSLQLNKKIGLKTKTKLLSYLDTICKSAYIILNNRGKP